MLRPDRYWQVKSLSPLKFRLEVSGHCPAPLCKLTNPQIPTTLSPDQVPAQVE